MIPVKFDLNSAVSRYDSRCFRKNDQKRQLMNVNQNRFPNPVTQIQGSSECEREIERDIYI